MTPTERILHREALTNRAIKGIFVVSSSLAVIGFFWWFAYGPAAHPRACLAYTETPLTYMYIEAIPYPLGGRKCVRWDTDQQ